MLLVLLLAAVEVVVGDSANGKVSKGGRLNKRDIRYVEIQIGDDGLYEYFDVYPGDQGTHGMGFHVPINDGPRQVVDQRLYGPQSGTERTKAVTNTTISPGSSQRGMSHKPTTAHQRTGSDTTAEVSDRTSAVPEARTSSTRRATMWKVVPFPRAPTTRPPPTYAPIGRCGYFPPKTTTRRPATKRTTTPTLTTRRPTRRPTTKRTTTPTLTTRRLTTRSITTPEPTTRITTQKTSTTLRASKPGGCAVVRTTTAKPTSLLVDQYLAAWALFRHKNAGGRSELHNLLSKQGKDKDLKDIQTAFHGASHSIRRSKRRDQSIGTRVFPPAGLRSESVVKETKLHPANIGVPGGDVPSAIFPLRKQPPKRTGPSEVPPEGRERYKKPVAWWRDVLNLHGGY